MQTNWIVITGAPCSGKSTVIDTLRERGCHVGEEIVRQYLNAKIAEGASVEKIRADIATFQRTIFRLHLKRESETDPCRTIFLDRGIPDIIAYYHFRHLDATPVFKASHKHRYKQIFFFDRLPMEKDKVRLEDEKDAEVLGRLIHRAYASLDYELIRVPVMSVEERVEFVLSRVQG